MDRVVAVIRRHVLADQQPSAWITLGRVAAAAARIIGLVLLYCLRFALAAAETARGLRRVVLDGAPLPALPEPPAPEAIGPPRTKKAVLLALYRAHPHYGDRAGRSPRHQSAPAGCLARPRVAQHARSGPSQAATLPGSGSPRPRTPGPRSAARRSRWGHLPWRVCSLPCPPRPGARAGPMHGTLCLGPGLGLTRWDDSRPSLPRTVACRATYRSRATTSSRSWRPRTACPARPVLAQLPL